MSSRTESPPSETQTPRGLNHGVVAVFLLALAAHLQAVTCGWIWDDDSYITANRVVQSADGLLALWWPGATPQYYPLVFLGFWIEHAIFGLEPFWFHLTNVVMHAASAALMAVVLRRLGVPYAAWAAAIFATHPMGVESVAWVTERKNVQSMLFALLSARFFLPLLETGQGRSVSTWVVSFAFFVAALLSKTTAVFLAPCLIMAALWRGRRIDSGLMTAVAPFFCAGVALGLLTAWLERTHVGATGADFALSWADRLQLAGLTTSFYIQAFTLPIEQIFIYPRFAPQAGSISQWVPFTICAVLLALACAKWKHQRAPLLLVLWLGAALFPALGFFDVWPFRFSYVADHFAYAAIPCLATIAVLVGTRVSRMLGIARVPARIAAVGVICTLVLLSNRAIPKYVTEEALWMDTLEKNPEAWIAANNLASIKLTQAREAMASGDQSSVEDHAEEALRFASLAGTLKPTEFTNAVNRSEAQRLLGRAEEALAEIELAARLAPGLSDIEWMRGRALALVGQTREARDAFVLAAELARSTGEEIIALRELIRLSVDVGSFAEAADACTRLVELAPGDADMSANLASLLIAAGRHEAGRQALLRAAQFDQSAFSSPDIWIRVSIRYLKLATESTLDPREATAARHLAARLVAYSAGDSATRYLQLAVEFALGDPTVRVEIEEIARQARINGDLQLAADIEEFLVQRGTAHPESR